MAKGTVHDKLVQEALGAINEIFHDETVSLPETKDSLLELRDLINEHLKSIDSELEED